MYNRYIPQPDGSYRRDRMPEPDPEGPPRWDPEGPPRQPSTGPSFLKQLLPKDFDTGDLIVLLLLLLMAGDSEKDRNTAILTMALYLLM